MLETAFALPRRQKSRFILLATFLSSATAGTNQIGKDFLAEKRKESDVIELQSGLLYKVLREGDGDAHPLADTDCECHYEGRTAQEYMKTPKGKKFDSSYDRGSPTNFSPSGVIAGWTEAMQLMVVGDKWEMYIPSELGYGDGGQGGDIGAGDVLVFTMELLKINGPSKPAERGPTPFAELTDKESFEHWMRAAGAAKWPIALAVLKQPIATSKLFAGFKQAAKKSYKRMAADEMTEAWVGGYSLPYAVTASSKFEKGKYTVDPVAAETKLDAPGVYVSTRSDRKKWVKCKTPRPTESTSEAISEKIEACVKAAAETPHDEL